MTRLVGTGMLRVKQSFMAPNEASLSQIQRPHSGPQAPIRRAEKYFRMKGSEARHEYSLSEGSSCSSQFHRAWAGQLSHISYRSIFGVYQCRILHEMLEVWIDPKEIYALYSRAMKIQRVRSLNLDLFYFLNLPFRPSRRFDFQAQYPVR